MDRHLVFLFQFYQELVELDVLKMARESSWLLSLPLELPVF